MVGNSLQEQCSEASVTLGANPPTWQASVTSYVLPCNAHIPQLRLLVHRQPFLVHLVGHIAIFIAVLLLARWLLG